MRIRWTTRIALAVGVLTITAAVAAGGGAASAAQAGRNPAGSSAGSAARP
jgi:hypothetical protein